MTDLLDRDPTEARLAATLRAKAGQLDLDHVPAVSTVLVPAPLVMTNDGVAGDDRSRAGRARRGRLLAGLAAAVALVVLAALVVSVHHGSTVRVASPDTSTNPAPDDGMALLARLRAIPASVGAAVGAGTAPLTLPSVDDRGTPSHPPAVLYVGAEFCPFCAAQRWPLVLALGRFGTFSNLGLTTSSATEQYPNTASFSFHGSSYASPYLTFTGVETETNQSGPDGGGAPLDHTTPAESTLEHREDPQGSIPFVSLDQHFVTLGATFDVRLLSGLTADQIATALGNPSTPISQAVWGEANRITAELCQLTGHQPANVCTDPAISALSGSVGSH